MRLYHGTYVGNAFQIAEAGEIRSPWDQEIAFLKYLRKLGKTSFIAEHPDKSLEEIALLRAASRFGNHELEHRVKAVSFTKILNDALIPYCLGFEEAGGGVVLGIEAEDQLMKKIDNGVPVVYVPRSLSLNLLKEVHLSPQANKTAGDKIRAAFSPYSPAFLEI